MFATYPAFRPVINNPPVVDSATVSAGELPAVRSMDDRRGIMTRLRFVMEDPGQQLSNAAAHYIIDQLSATQNQPAAVVIPVSLTRPIRGVSEMNRIRGSWALLMLATLSSLGASVPSSAAEYGVVEKFSGNGGAWDYAVIDEHTSRLYLAQQGVTALDLKTGILTNGLVKAQMTHGLAPLGTARWPSTTPRPGRLRSSTAHRRDSRDHSDGTGESGHGIHALDALVFEPKTGCCWPSTASRVC